MAGNRGFKRSTGRFQGAAADAVAHRRAWFGKSKDDSFPSQRDLKFRCRSALTCISHHPFKIPTGRSGVSVGTVSKPVFGKASVLASLGIPWKSVLAGTLALPSARVLRQSPVERRPLRHRNDGALPRRRYDGGEKCGLTQRAQSFSQRTQS